MNKLFKFYIDYRIKQILKSKKYKHFKDLHFVNLIYHNHSSHIKLQFGYLNNNDVSDIKTNCSSICSDCDCNKFKLLRINIF